MNNKTAIQIMLGLLSIVVVFHFCIMAKIIPYNIAWGGRIGKDTEMYVFETVSILINLFLGFILFMKGNYITFQFREKIVNRVLWIFLVIFILNTVGNVFAKTNFEKFFAVLTLLFALLIWRILRKHNGERTSSVPV
jgi:hypothetical protein